MTFFYSCKKAVWAISSEPEMGFWSRKMLRFHLFMCRHCRDYAYQINLIDEYTRKMLIQHICGDDSDCISELESQFIDTFSEKGN